VSVGGRAPRPRLADGVRLDIVYDDQTEFGSAVSGRIDREVVRVAGAEAAHHPPREACDLLFAPTRLGALYAAPDRLRPEILYPDPGRVRPVALRVLRGAAGADGGDTITLPPDLTGELARWLGDWQLDASEPRSGAALQLWRALREVGAIDAGEGEASPASARPPAPASGAVFAGHATVRIDDGHEAQLFDPFFVPASAGTPASYAPLTVNELRAGAVFITHSHPDHFALGTLLRLGADTPIFVPAVARENILAIDMAARLEQVGFRAVRTLAWNDSARFDHGLVTALPFLGEQPTVSDQLHATIRNMGNTYRVESAGMRYGIIADAGSDREGTTEALAENARERGLGVDILFGGYRAWSLYPHQYLGTSVARYLLFVPPALRAVRQRIMNDAVALIDTAERWGARTVVPYADGGAPWFWEMGLGPRCDDDGEDEHFDPAPEVVERAAHFRSNVRGAAVRSPVAVRIARPGQRIAGDDPDDRPIDLPGHEWPYRPASQAAALLRRTTMTERELVALARKKVLLRLLAAPEIERLDIQVVSSDVQRLLDGLRRDSGLARAQDMKTWMQSAGLDEGTFTDLIYEWTGIVKLEERYRTEIDALVDAQVGFGTMRNWPRAR
jgi:L-ascorbate metabolism protein UlaG (beta-lactamase superfamily)